MVDAIPEHLAKLAVTIVGIYKASFKGSIWVPLRVPIRV